ncbi:hypothetical protein OHD66_002587 [Enterococcus faecalis]|nr:hypothetical protein [Enterococcus faecalis]
MGKLFLITTLSGSKYKVSDTDNEKWLERIPSHQASQLRKDGTRIKIYKILQLKLGKPAVFVLEPLGMGNLTIRETTKVVALIIPIVANFPGSKITT